MRPLLLPGLLDAARHNAAHGRAERRAVRVGRTSTGPPGRSTRRPRARPAGRRPPHERHHLGALLTLGAARRLAQPGPRRPTSTRARALRRGACSSRPACELAARSPASRRSCIPAARPRCWPATARARLDRRAAPAGGARVGPGGPRPPSSSTWTRWPSWPPARRRLPRRDELPGRAPGHRGGGARRRAAPPRWRRPCAPAAASCSADVERLRRLPRRAGGGGQQVARAAARVPRARPHAHRRGGGRAARGDRGELAEIGGRLRA